MIHFNNEFNTFNNTNIASIRPIYYNMRFQLLSTFLLSFHNLWFPKTEPIVA